MIRALILGALACWAKQGPAQTDSLLPPIHVQIPQDSTLLDSLWTGADWSWTGPCSGERLTVRLLDPATGNVAQRIFPCTPVTEQAAVSEIALPRAVGHALEIHLTRTSVAAWTWGQPASCFPPLPSTALASATADWDALDFEREQLAAIADWASTRCLSPDLVRACLMRLESEDRRLALLESLLPRCSQPNSVKVDDLFFLRSTREKAAQLVGK